MSRTPLYDAVYEYVKLHTERFHMPGHKGKAIGDSFLNSVYQFDLTEISGLDNLFESSDVIFKAEQNVAELYNVRASYFSAGGATLCIQTALFLATRRNKRIIVERNCHRSVINTIALLDLEPVWLTPRMNTQFGIPDSIDISYLEKLLQTENVGAILINSPNYYGVASDIVNISRLCKKYNVISIIDNSHGSHFAFLPPSSKITAPETYFDFCIDSLHKTLPVLTGGALLNINTEIEKSNVLQAMSLFGSSSPSYLILSSIDYGMDYMRQYGIQRLKQITNACNNFRERLKDIGVQVLSGGNIDPTRLTLNFESFGFLGGEMARLLESRGIFVEMSDLYNVVLICTVMDDEKSFDNTFNAIAEITDGIKPKKVTPHIQNPFMQSLNTYIRGADILSAISSPCEKCEKISIKDSLGKISATALTPYPTGVPIVLPGERITYQAVEYCKDFFEDIIIIKEENL